MLFFMYDTFHNKKEKPELSYFIKCCLQMCSGISSFSFIHSYFAEFSPCQFLQAGENAIYIKTIKAIIF